MGGGMSKHATHTRAPHLPTAREVEVPHETDTRAPHLPTAREVEVPHATDTRAPHLPTARKVEVPAEAMELWVEWGGAEVEAVLASGAVMLLDARWLIAQAKSGFVLKPRQALPDEAFLSLSEVQAATYVSAYWEKDKQSLPVVSISHCWLQPNHPDPHGYNLRLVARALESRLEYLVYYGYRDPRLAVFYDFSSIHQNCRDRDGAPQATTCQPTADGGLVGLVDGAVGRFAEETVLFKQALGSLGAFYSHPKTLVFKLTAFPPDYSDERRYKHSGNVAPYLDRGWCFCESAWAAMVKAAFLVMDLSVDPTNENDYDWFRWWKMSSEGRGAPLLPDRFKEQLEDKSFTNGKDDKPLVTELYRASFKARFGQVTELVYAGIGWGDAQVAALVAVLDAGAAPKLKQLECAPPARARARPCSVLRACARPRAGLDAQPPTRGTH